MQLLSAYGHSWIAGDGATEPARGLVEVAAGDLKMTANNCGVGGSLSVDAASLVTVQPPQASDVFVLMIGLNDARLYGTLPGVLESYTAALETLFAAFQVANPEAAVIAIEQPYLAEYAGHAPHNRGADVVIDAYNSALSTTAKEWPRVHVTPVPGWDTGTMLDEDTVHPNDAGHAYLADVVVTAVKAITSNRTS